MKNGFRASMAWLHTYSGLLTGWLLFMVFATGTAAYWRPEITYWMKPELHRLPQPEVSAQAQPGQVRHAVQWLQRHAGDSPRWFMSLPDAREPEFNLLWLHANPDPKAGRAGRFAEATLDASGQPLPDDLAPRQTRGGNFFYRLHFDLHYIPPVAARWVVGFCAMFMLVAILSGIVTHRRIFADFFTFRPGKGQRSWLDAHNALAVLALPYHLMITYTGLCTLVFMYYPWTLPQAYGQGGDALYRMESTGRPPLAPPTPGQAPAAPLTDVAALVLDAQQRWQAQDAQQGVRAAAAGRPLAGRILVENPGKATASVSITRAREDTPSMRNDSPTLHYDGVSGAFRGASGQSGGAAVQGLGVMVGLHAARFAQPLLRALFFLSGLMGCAMVATGLLLWAVKERPKHLKAVQQGRRGSWALRVVDGLNLGAVGGLLVAMPAYFWANRLLPADMADRARMEETAFFAVWALCALIGLARPRLGMWRGMLAVAGLLLALTPLLNALTGGAHWGQSLPAGLWRVAGFDAVCLLLGLGLLAAARRVGQRQRADRQRAATGKASEKNRPAPDDGDPRIAPLPAPREQAA